MRLSVARFSIITEGALSDFHFLDKTDSAILLQYVAGCETGDGEAICWAFSEDSPPVTEPFFRIPLARHPINVRKSEAGWYFARHYHPLIEPLGIHIEDQWKNFTVYNADSRSEVCLQYLYTDLGRMFAYAVLPRGGIVLHAVAMRWRNKAVLLSAASGTGKTTHAGLWQQIERVEIINGDRALCVADEGAWSVYGQPWCGSSGQSINTSSAIGAIVLLEQSEKNEIVRLSAFEAAHGLLPRVFAPSWDAALAENVLDCLDSMTAQIPVFRLRCRPDAEAVLTLRHALERLFN